MAQSKLKGPATCCRIICHGNCDTKISKMLAQQGNVLRNEVDKFLEEVRAR